MKQIYRQASSDVGARTADLTTTNTLIERYDADGAIYDTVQKTTMHDTSR